MGEQVETWAPTVWGHWESRVKRQNSQSSSTTESHRERSVASALSGINGLFFFKTSIYGNEVMLRRCQNMKQLWQRGRMSRGVFIPAVYPPRFLPIAGPLCVLSLDLVYWRSSVRCPRECGEGSLVPGVGSKREMPALVLPGVELTPPDPAFFILNTTPSRGMRVILHLGCNQWAYCFRVAAGTLSSLARKTVLGIQVNESVQLPPLFSTERIVCWYLGLYYYVSFT